MPENIKLCLTLGWKVQQIKGFYEIGVNIQKSDSIIGQKTKSWYYTNHRWVNCTKKWFGYNLFINSMYDFQAPDL